MTALHSAEPSFRPAGAADVPRMAAIHLAAFPNFFLTILGRRFLVELYQGILTDQAGVAVVCVAGGEVRGFVAGTVAPANFYGRLIRRRWLRFALAALGPAIRRPAIVPRLLRAFRKPAEERQSPDGALLMSIAVDPAAQRGGIGARLVAEFCTACRQRGVTRIRLTTDRLGNEAVNDFYVRHGFRVAGTFTTPEGREMNEYVLDLSGQNFG